MAQIKISSVHTLKIADPVMVEVEHTRQEDLYKIQSRLLDQIKSQKQIADAVANVFVYAIELCPKANPSDIWQHLVYRGLLSRGYNDQQWKRISGFALERALTTIYAPRIAPYDLRMRELSGGEAHRLFSQLGMVEQIKRDKLDRIIEVRRNNDYLLVAGLHIKASIDQRQL